MEDKSRKDSSKKENILSQAVKLTAEVA